MLESKHGLYKNIPNILSVFRMVLVLPFLLTIHDIFVYNCGKNWILLLYSLLIIKGNNSSSIINFDFM
jgi:phosphatidylglycerophosphate synthase